MTSKNASHFIISQVTSKNTNYFIILQVTAKNTNHFSISQVTSKNTNHFIVSQVTSKNTNHFIISQLTAKNTNHFSISQVTSKNTKLTYESKPTCPCLFTTNVNISIAATRIFCQAPPVFVGDPATLTCHYPEDLSQSRKGISVHRRDSTPGSQYGEWGVHC